MAPALWAPLRDRNLLQGYRVLDLQPMAVSTFPVLDCDEALVMDHEFPDRNVAKLLFGLSESYLPIYGIQGLRGAYN